MTRTVTQLGGGINDATGTYGTISSATDYVSAWTPSSTAGYPHGGYDATGVTANTTVRPLNVVQLGGNIGGTSAGGNSTASIYWQLATDNAGGNGYQESTATTTNSTATKKYTKAGAAYDNGSLAWNIVAGTTYYYGIHGANSGVFVFARGGTGSIYVNGTASSAWAGNSFSAQIIWDTIPNAPTLSTATISSNGTVVLSWTCATNLDDGMSTTAAWDDSSGNHITGYNIIYKASSASAWKVLKAKIAYNAVTVSGTTRTTASLTPDNGYFIPGQTYDFKVAATNGTTDAVQTDYSAITAQTGVRSNTVTAQMPGGIRNASGAWAPFNIRVYNGSSWVTPSTFKIYNGSTWKPLI